MSDSAQSLTCAAGTEHRQALLLAEGQQSYLRREDSSQQKLSMISYIRRQISVVLDLEHHAQHQADFCFHRYAVGLLRYILTVFGYGMKEALRTEQNLDQDS